MPTSLRAAPLLRYGLAGASILGAGALASAAASRLACNWIEERHPPRGLFINVEGARLHVWEGGRRNGLPVVLLHGACGNLSDMTLNLAPALANRYRVIAIDRPGHGWSERGSASQASPRRQARMIAQALSKLDASPAVIVGHSWAGALAACIAIEQPEAARAIVLVAAATQPWPCGLTWYYRAALDSRFSHAFTRTILAPALLARIEAATRDVFAPQCPPREYVERTSAALLASPSRFLANAQDLLALLEYVREAQHSYSRIELPVRIIAGDADKIVPVIHSRKIHRSIPHSSLTILPGVGHMPHHVAVDSVSREVDLAAAQESVAAAGRRAKKAPEDPPGLRDWRNPAV